MPKKNSGGAAPLIAHVLHRLDVGGLENGLVNLINRMPPERFRHAVVCMTDFTDFSQRIHRPDVELIALHKPPGNNPGILAKLAGIFGELRPAVVHTRNLGALEAQVPAALRRVPVRIHGEHGWDVGDLDGSSRKNRWIRKLHAPFVQHYIALSEHIARYLVKRVNIPRQRISQVYNGVDTDQFRPATEGRATLPYLPFAAPHLFCVGAVGRMEPVKDQLTLVRAFIRALRMEPEAAALLRLVVVGDGSLRLQAQHLLKQDGLADLAWFAGARDDVADILRGLDLFVLPSLSEGISNTVLEAMATALPVIATSVGGNPELIEDGRTGCLVPAGDVERMARAILIYLKDSDLARRHGAAARKRAVERFSLDTMVASYMDIYDRQLAKRGIRGA